MEIALTIGIMFLIFGFIMYMREDGPRTFIDDINPLSYVVIGVIVLINCGQIYNLKELLPIRLQPTPAVAAKLRQCERRIK